MDSKIMNGNNALSNWEKPEGKLGTVVLALLIGGGLYGLYKVLPFLLTIAWGALELGLAACLIAVLIFLVTNKQIKMTAEIIFFMIMKNIRGFIVETDPIAIVERRLRDMKIKIGEISKAMGDLTGLIRGMRQRLVEKENDFKTQLARKEVSERQGNAAAAQVANNQAVRLNEVIISQKQRLADSTKWLEVLTKLEEMASLTVEDTENAVAIRKEEFITIKQQHKAFKSVMSVMKGDPDEMAMFNAAMDNMANDINAKLGEMEHVLDSTGGLLQQYSTDNGVASLKADELLTRYNKDGMNMFEAFDVKAKPATTVTSTPQSDNVTSQETKKKYF